MNRRKFIQGTVLFGSTLLFSPRSFALNPSEKHFYIVFKMEGGWDTTLSLDPKVHHNTTQEDIFIEYTPDKILQGNSLKFGPAMESLKPYLNEISVINGIDMRRDGGHEVNLNMMTTGYGAGDTASYAGELWRRQESGIMGVIGDIETAGVPVPIVDLNSLVNSSSLIPEDLAGMFDRKDFGMLDGAVSGLMKGNEKFPKVLETKQQLDAAGFDNEEFNMLAALFKHNLCYQAELDLFTNGSLDSHSNHEGQHLQGQSEMWSQLANAIKVLKSVEYENGKSLYDLTTIMVTSEFSRTPALNGGKGKDHNPRTNSVMLMGKNVNPGVSLGESFNIKAKDAIYGIAEQRSYPIDFKTGTVVKTAAGLNDNVDMIFPEHVAATIAKIFNSPEKFIENKQLPTALPFISKV